MTKVSQKSMLHARIAELEGRIRDHEATIRSLRANNAELLNVMQETLLNALPDDESRSIITTFAHRAQTTDELIALTRALLATH